MSIFNNNKSSINIAVEMLTKVQLYKCFIYICMISKGMFNLSKDQFFSSDVHRRLLLKLHI